MDGELCHKLVFSNNQNILQLPCFGQNSPGLQIFEKLKCRLNFSAFLCFIWKNYTLYVDDRTERLKSHRFKSFKPQDLPSSYFFIDVCICMYVYSFARAWYSMPYLKWYKIPGSGGQVIKAKWTWKKSMKESDDAGRKNSHIELTHQYKLMACWLPFLLSEELESNMGSSIALWKESWESIQEFSVIFVQCCKLRSLSCLPCTVVHTTVSSRLDYCDVLCMGLPIPGYLLGNFWWYRLLP